MSTNINFWYIFQWVILICIICTNDISCLRGSVLNKICVTPNGHEGKCLMLATCSVLNELLERKNEPGVKSFLRGSHCGFEGRNIVVCCPKNETKMWKPPIAAKVPNVTQDTFRPVTGAPQTSFATHSSATTLDVPNSTMEMQKPTATSELLSIILDSDKKKKVEVLKEIDLSPEEMHWCGINNATSTKIVGGRDAELGSWPWIVAIGYPENNGGASYRCGGTLITDKHVITAAHCILLGGSRPFTVRLGDLNLDDSVNDGAYPIDIGIKDIIFHEKFTYIPKVVNDIAIIILDNSVKFNKLIRPVCLPPPALMKKLSKLQHRYVYVSGWGTTSFGNHLSSTKLYEACIPMYDDEKCKNSYKGSITALIDDRVICAGGNGKDACQGDSGGPLVFKYSSTAYLIGIVSYGKGCGDAQYPGVYTRVSYFLDWIATHVEIFRNCISDPETCAIRPKKTQQVNYETMPCGRSNQTIDDIVDGQDSKPGSHPWIVGIGFNVQNTVSHLCAGVLISDRHVLSTAACIGDPDWLPTEVRMGALEIGYKGKGVTEEALKLLTDIPVERIIVHENYKQLPRQDDIGIVVLKTPVTFSDRIQPICLPVDANSKVNDFQNKTLLSAGWGYWSHDETRNTSPLRDFKYYAYESKKCKNAYEDDNEALVDKRVICAGKKDNTTCSVDQGSPLITKENGKFYLIGLFMYGAEICGHPDKPNIHINVSYYIDWIIENTRY